MKTDLISNNQTKRIWWSYRFWNLVDLV